VRFVVVNPAELITNSCPVSSFGTPVTFGAVNFRALGSPVMKKEAKAPGEFVYISRAGGFGIGETGVWIYLQSLDNEMDPLSATN
jgi:hypothetical protein